MCGIFGMMGSFSGDEINSKLTAMARLLKHRGPDDEGFHVEQDKGTGIGMTRLSIVDRAGGHQPIYNEDESLVIVLNGEIYNYRELREELTGKGHHFRTMSDAESVLHLYEEEGSDAVSRLNGMFAFAILDRRTGELFIARDRFGVKHLIYSFHKGFIFASELKGLFAFKDFPTELDEQAVSDYFALWYVPVPRCIVKHAKKLPQAHWMRVRSPDDIEMKRYWEPVYSEKKISDFNELREEYFFHHRNAVRRQLQGEVPIGVFLSGGLDSGSIVAMLAETDNTRYHTFSMGFDQPSFDETPLIKATSERFNTNHHHYIMKGEDILPIIEDVTYSMDQPLGLQAYPYYMLASKAKEYVTVVLSGEGGDEILGGYDTYCGHPYLQFYRKFPSFFRKWFKDKFMPMFPHSSNKLGFDLKVRKFIEAAEFSPERAHVSWREIFTPGEKEQLLNVSSEVDMDPYHAFKPYIELKSIPNLVNRFMYADLAIFLPEATLTEADRLGMAHSLEFRVPFMDNDFFNFMADIPVNLKLRGLTPKFLTRKVLRGVLPDKVVSAPKGGFTPPMPQWISGPLREYFIDLLNAPFLKECGIINVKYAQNVLNEHLDKKADHSRRLMLLFFFANWYKVFVANRNARFN
jgi:asparagine synthase (glutamine-hydrolysing)